MCVYQGINRFAVAAFVALVFVAPALSQFTITQITDNEYDDTNPQVSGTNIVWEGELGDMGDDYREIFLRTAGVTARLTTNEVEDVNPFISEANVVWQREDTDEWEYEVYFYDGTVQKVADTGFHSKNRENAPRISGSNVVYRGHDGVDPEIYYWGGGGSPEKISSVDHADDHARISGAIVVWDGQPAFGEEDEIYRYSGSYPPDRLTTNELWDEYPEISGQNVVWQWTDETPAEDVELSYFNGSTTVQITNNDTNDWGQKIAGDRVVWEDGYTTSTAANIFFWQEGDTQPTLLTDNGRNPQVSENFVVWESYDDDGDWEIFVWDGAVTQQITDNLWLNDRYPQISGTTVVWQGDYSLTSELSFDYEIYMTVVPESSAVLLAGLGLGAVVAFGRRPSVRH